MWILTKLCASMSIYSFFVFDFDAKIDLKLILRFSAFVRQLSPELKKVIVDGNGKVIDLIRWKHLFILVISLGFQRKKYSILRPFSARISPNKFFYSNDCLFVIPYVFGVICSCLKHKFIDFHRKRTKKSFMLLAMRFFLLLLFLILIKYFQFEPMINILPTFI